MRFISLAVLLFSAGSLALASNPAAPAAAAAPARQEAHAYAIKARRDGVPPHAGDAHLLFPTLSEYHDEHSQADGEDEAPRLMRLMRRAKSRRPKAPRLRNNNEDNSTANETESAAPVSLSLPLGGQLGYGLLLGYGSTTALFTLFIVVLQYIAL